MKDVDHLDDALYIIDFVDDSVFAPPGREQWMVWRTKLLADALRILSESTVN